MRYRGITPESQAKWDQDVQRQYDYAAGLVRRYLERSKDESHRDIIGTEHEHHLTLSLAEWIISHTTVEERAKYPFCWDCGRGHDSAKVSCETVDELVSAEESVGP